MLGTTIGLAVGLVAAVVYRRRSRWRLGGADGPFGVVFLAAAALAGVWLAGVVILTVGLVLGLLLWAVLNYFGTPYWLAELVGLPVGLALGIIIGIIIRKSSSDDYGLP